MKTACPRLRAHLAAIALLVGVLAGPSAEAYVLADTCGHAEPDCPILHWDTDGDPVGFRLQHDGGADLSFWAFETEVRLAFAKWAEVPSASVEFEEGGLFMGEAAYQETDGIDRESVLFFVEDGWAPRSPEVIALTSITFGEGGVIIEADIGFNADDWLFTVGDDGVVVDFQSIVLHEIGHFLGLDHSEVESAVMHARYDEGETSRRALTSDDVAGVSELYPCASGECVGDVGPGCAVVDRLPPARGLVFAVLLGLLAALGDRRRRLAGGALLGAVALLAMPTPSVGSVVERLDLDALFSEADVVVRATVADVEAYRARGVRSRITLDTTESWKGLAPDTIELDQPGGRLPDLGTLVFGMPRFTDGDDVVVFLRWPEGGAPSVVGLAQGKLDVAGGGALSRDPAGLSLAYMRTRAAGRSVTLPPTVDALRERLRPSP